MILITALIHDFEFTIYLPREEENNIVNTLARRSIKYYIVY